MLRAHSVTVDRLRTNRPLLALCASLAAAGIATGIGDALDLNAKPGAQVVYVVLAAAAAAVGGFWAGILAGVFSFPLFIYLFLNNPDAFHVATSRITSLVVLGVGFVLVSYIVAREQRARALSADARDVQDALTQAGMAIWEWDPERDRVRWSHDARGLFGLPRSQRIDTREELLEAVNPDDREALQHLLDGTLETGGEFEVEVRTTLASDGWRWVLLQGNLRRGVRGRRISGLARDVSVRRRSVERERFLGGLTRALAGAPDYDGMLAELARIAVPELGDWCWVDVLEDDGSIRNVVAQHVDPTKTELVRELRRRFPVEPGTSHGAAVVLASGRSKLYAEVTESVLRQGIPDEEALDLYRRLDPQSSIVSPLRARGRTIGALTVVAAETARRYTQDDLAFVEEVAQLAALMIDNARLHRDEQGARRDAEGAALRMERLQALTARLSAAVSPTEVAQIIVDESRDVLGARAAWVSMLEGNELRHLAASGYREEFMQKYRRIPLGSDLVVAEAVRRGKPRWVETMDGEGDRHPELAEGVGATGGESVAYLPLIGATRRSASWRCGSTARVSSVTRNARRSPASSSSAASRSSAPACTRPSATREPRPTSTAASCSSSARSRTPWPGRSRSRSSSTSSSS